ncbi:hypothetical protein PHYSODRAFT_304421 [Phytophthora sojae]|uniref:ATPase AAA-type core domain-containing protein n=1 Tax=Phytophthora sojae (strain P6497) TaxID=1094619 RepID=G5A0W3_PHYSP|nr:hypothetical protein PHYSODRAFT_304421 [Phytophthora sojae]EGZ10595.1 hypothetical protein PHYSODRAFT_304421 [Phytophthora sojae]|eukprot:XP_009533340.1 hypothetical protein PHYSODRAFT_304421 [Phytophthora sojae]
MDPPLPLQIHVLVVLPPSNDGPPRKKVKLTQHKTVVYQGPVHLEAYSVPMESIKAYKSLEASLSSPHDTVRPLCLLYGPRQFGKTTIAHRLWNFVKGFPSVFVNFCTLTPTNTKSEDTFWGALSRGSAASSREFEAMLQERGERVWLVIDEMDVMFRNEKLTSKFLDVLRNWQTSPYFFGFLGVGTHDLVKLPQMQSGRRGVGPFNLCNLMVKVERFSSEQMVVFFQLIEPSYPFSESTRAAIMNYSAGAPGVFGSLIRCSIDRLKCTVERYEWEHWLKIDSFYAYLETYNWTYSRLRDDLVDFLDYSDWKSLISLLRNCDNGALEFSSPMMRRVCLEALPIRHIDEVLAADDPLELLATSLQYMETDVIGALKGQTPSESALQCELYESIRGIFTSNSVSTRNIIAEDREIDKQRRFDIIVNHEVKYGIELRANLLTAADVAAAVGQADDYREFLRMDKLFLINFLPQSHEMELVYQVAEYPAVRIIHARCPESGKKYEVLHVETP